MHIQSDPELIEGDEGEVVLNSKVPRGEDLLVKDYLLDNTPPPPPSVTTNTGNTPSIQPQPVQATPTSVPRTNTATLTHQPSSNEGNPSSVLPLDQPPSIRPVTPLSYRPQSSTQINTQTSSGIASHIIQSVSIKLFFSSLDNSSLMRKVSSAT